MKSKMKVFKKTLAMILTATMVSGMIPLTVFADEILLQNGTYETDSGQYMDEVSPSDNNVISEDTDVENAAEALSEIGDERLEEEPESLRDDSIGVIEYVAELKTGSADAVLYEDFEEAWSAFDAALPGSTLKLLSNITTEKRLELDSDNGTINSKDDPKILNLNDHGILYKGELDKEVIMVCYGSGLEITDQSESQTLRYITLSDHHGTYVYDDVPGSGTDYAVVRGGYITGGRASGIYIGQNAYLRMSGGTICANSGITEGGGVTVSYQGSFDMTGGIIENNFADSGGGVFIDDVLGDDIYAIGTDTPFTMNGGRIRNNIAESLGGGIYNKERQPIIISDGEICGNYAGKDGGGIHNGYFDGTKREQSIDLKGGLIRGNCAGKRGGGIYNHGMISFSGGEIRDNTAPAANAIYHDAPLDSDLISFEGTLIAGERKDGRDAKSVNSIGIYKEINTYGYFRIGDMINKGDSVLIKKANGAVCSYEDPAEGFEIFRVAEPGSVLKLLKDLTTEKTIEISGGNYDSPIVLDLNDHGILYTGSEPASVIHVMKNTNLKIKDSSISATERYLELNKGRAVSVSLSLLSDNYAKMSGGYIAGGFTSNGEAGGGLINEGVLTVFAGTYAGNGGPSILMNDGAVYGFVGNIKAGEAEDGSDISSYSVEQAAEALEIGCYFVVEPVLDNGDNIVTVAEKGAGAVGYEDFEEALFDWNTSGPGAILTLLDDIKTDKAIIVYRGTKEDPLVLDLNDHGIIYTPTGAVDDLDTFSPVIYVNGTGSFELTDRSEEKTERYLLLNDSGRATEISLEKPSESTQYVCVTGGYIGGGYKIGNYTSYYNGGGILNNGITVMSGGTVAGNIGKGIGGVGNNGYFTMKDGIIIENSSRAIYANGSDSTGGGVVNSGDFIMNGGIISDNYAAYGAGVYNRKNANFLMNGGKIVNNVGWDGAGLYNEGTAVMACGLISENSEGAVDCAHGGSFTMKGGEISKNVYTNGEEVTPATINFIPSNSSASFEGVIYAGIEGDGSDAIKVSGEDLIAELEEKGILHYGYLRVEGNGGNEPGQEPEPLRFTHDPVNPPVYTGKAIKPAVKVYYGTMLLTEGSDYTIKYDHNIDAGIASFTINGKGNYSGNDSDTFEILKKDISALSISKIASVAYNKKNCMPVPAITYNGKKLKKDTDFRISYYLNSTDALHRENPVTPKAPAHYYVTIDGIGNYNGTISDDFIIASSEETPVSKLTVGKIPDQPYKNGEAVEPAPVIKNGKRPLSEGTDYELFYGINKEIGTGTVRITGKGSYVGVRTATFKIIGKPMNKVSILGMKTAFTYDGKEKTQDIDELTIRYKSPKKASYEVLNAISEADYNAIEDEAERRSYDCVISYKNNLIAGKATMIIKGINGYQGSLSKTFNIRSYDISADPKDRFKVSLEKAEYAYSKSSVKPVPAVTFRVGDEDRVLKEGRDYTVSYLNNSSLNDNTGLKHPTVKITGKGNFRGIDKTSTFAIVKANLGDAENGFCVNANGVVWKDMAGNYKTGVTVTDAAGKKLKAGTDYEKAVKYYLDDKELTGTEKLPSGTDIRIEVTGKGKYCGTADAIFRIAKTDISQLSAAGPDRNYTGSPMTIREDEIIWMNKKKKVQEGITCRIVPGTYRNNRNKGVASVDVEGTDDCCGRKTVTFKINVGIIMFH